MKILICGINSLKKSNSNVKECESKRHYIHSVETRYVLRIPVSGVTETQVKFELKQIPLEGV